MKALIQRVIEARVTVAETVVGEIGTGMLVLVGIDRHDTEESVSVLTERMLKYRLFADDTGKMNLDIAQSGGGILLVSQFTLSADTSKGLRPGFSSAASPDGAEQLFGRVVAKVKESHPNVQKGRFGADMQVSLVNDGPVTFLLQN